MPIVGTVLLVLFLMACMREGGGPVSARAGAPDEAMVGCKTTVCRQGIISIYGNGVIEVHSWSGSQRQWQTGLAVVDYSVEGGVLYLLTDRGLLRFNLNEGPQSAEWIIRFQGNQRYLEIIGVAQNGVWMLRPAEEIDLVDSGRVLTHLEYSRLPVPPTLHEKY